MFNDLIPYINDLVLDLTHLLDSLPFEGNSALISSFITVLLSAGCGVIVLLCLAFPFIVIFCLLKFIWGFVYD